MAEPAWMLDTNTLSDLIRNPRGALVQRLSQIEPDSVCTSIVVACELRFGARRKGSETLTLRVEQLLASLAVLPFGEPGTMQTFVPSWSVPARPSAATTCSLPRMPVRLA